MVKKASTTTFGLLGMLAVRPWTGYEMTKQLRRSLRFVWPSSEGHLYREQKRLVALGWASVTREPAGKRTRNSYTITRAGEAALQEWLRTAPGVPRFEIEGVLRVFYADLGSPEDMIRSLKATASSAREMLDELLGFVGEYLEEGGPLWLLENGLGGPGVERRVHHGRVMYPERIHVIARAIDATTRLLSTVEEFSSETSAEVARWATTTDPALTPSTRHRLETIKARHTRSNPLPAGTGGVEDEST